MQTIRFTVDHEVPDGTGAKYKAGQVVRLSVASAQHFTKRSLAVEVTDEPRSELEGIEKDSGAEASGSPALADPVDVARGDGGIAGDRTQPEQGTGSHSPAPPKKRPYHRRK